MSAIESVRHDAAALCHFIDQVAEGCILASSPSYTEPSKEFFQYIFDLGEATKRHILSFVGSLDPMLAQSDPDAFYTEAQQIQTLRFSWFKLHRFVKPALDADTLQVPHPLVDALAKRLAGMTGFSKVRFAVIHTTELNYFQITSGYISALATDIAASVPGAPQFPPDLGIVGIPYSQSSSLFLNTAIAHEMGHFAFDKNQESANLFSQVVSGLMTNQGLSAYATVNGWPSGLVIQLCIETCITWLTEIYCDLFALYLVGPSFALAFIELMALTRVRRTALGSLPVSPINSLLEFSDTHPANAVRLREHVRFLSRSTINWWNQIESSTSEQVNLLRDAATLPDSAFTLDLQLDTEVNKAALEVFLQLTPVIHDMVENTFKGVPADVSSFIAQKLSIQRYLSYGVVPSRLVSGSSIEIPTLISLLNASHLFYLDGFAVLLQRINSAEEDCLLCRALWAKRLEMWTTKALEDIGG